MGRDGIPAREISFVSLMAYGPNSDSALTMGGCSFWNQAGQFPTGNQQWREGNQDSNQWSRMEGRNKHSTRKEWRNKQTNKKPKKKKGDFRNFWDNFQCSNITIIGEPEGEEEDQEIQNLFEKIMKENFPNLVKKIDIQVQEAQTAPINWIQRRIHQNMS